MFSQVRHPKTLTEAIRYYSDMQTCINAVAELRWADGKPVCPKCNTAEGARKHYWLVLGKLSTTGFSAVMMRMSR